MRAFLYHFHGLENFDLSDIDPSDIPSIQQAAEKRDYNILPTVYLRRENLPRFIDVMREYRSLHEANLVPNIAGFAIEGPMLGPQGGIPRAGRWYPSRREWEAIADLGPLGLRYIVMAPDALALEDVIDDQLTFADLLCAFYDRQVRVAFGHFHRDDPQRSAKRMRQVLEFLHGRYISSPYLVLTDHLYNDMPRNFVHTWRTPQERAVREEQLRKVLDPDWESADLNALLGPVPATMIQAAREALLFPCLNFDGYHVDLEICGRTLEYIGAERLIALTDHTEVDVMAREKLHRTDDNPLWLRDDGAVAAGSSGYEQQRENILSLGVGEDVVNQLFVSNPVAAIDYRVVAAVSA